ncbi:flagellar basal body L-ring protein [Stenotrophomonas chelatiphaga]|jgi:flagellar L-ring protein precursor FlgH|uniref:Flagellar L-ring protein n=2 Tax=Stenotrophomonas TaxID=40323 RepID=A0A0R0D9K9_9GAMM|nr:MULTISPECIES: flagellar basal body L-ring protein FlgH [Stenotrophomonas]KIP79608.1 flagellar basal body L-ring protein [Stenotrophomonas maltophilia]MBJ7515632.1 flagellar basal body L-ring protein FlgH [Stenotrophomonas sp.]KRG75186.1 flagellar basal body L-ring protein [Stenotrophomonas chelatiphaga]MBD7953091.1 flagellar basal body L-ring protein FlgH [Stenotrophomonas pennii]MBD8643033.1 flagellar basal body L-ring protein FlgH [Stenotrophomonas sp. CFBP 13724]
MLPAASLARLTFAAAAIALLGGCVIAGDVRPYPALAPVQPVMPPQAQATAGAIYAAGPSLQLYSDRRARDVGDLLTITLLENTQAQMSANTATSKESELAIGTPTIFGAPVTLGGKDILSATANGSRDFTGRGNSAQSNRLQGNVTVTVMQRLPNGNLVVQGQKNLRLNQGDELVQVQGIVRAADIAPDNTIPSSRVADARIVYGGRGAVAQSNAMGWLSRFFNSGLAPF